MSNRGVLGFIAGAVVGAAAGVVAGILVAPRPGSETRSMAADAAIDAWGNVVDAYHQGATDVTGKVDAHFEGVSATTDELRSKIEAARAKVDQLRTSIVDAVSSAGNDEIRLEVPIDDVSVGDAQG